MAVAEVDAKAPEEEDEESGEQAGGKTGLFAGKKKLLLFVGVPLLLLIVGGAGAYFGGLLDSLLGTGETAGAEHEEPARPLNAIFYDLPEMLVNLNSTGRKNNYLKLTISLELDDPASIPVIEAVMPRIIDNFQVYLRELRIEDLRGSAGLARLREELLTRINVAVRPAKVSDVLFREMLIQ